MCSVGSLSRVLVFCLKKPWTLDYSVEASIKDSDQTVCLRSLIWVFHGRTFPRTPIPELSCPNADRYDLKYIKAQGIFTKTNSVVMVTIK